MPSRWARVVGSILVSLVALFLGYGLWTVYELTPAAVSPGSPRNAWLSPPGEVSATDVRALQAYGGEALWKHATTVDSAVTVGGLLFQLKGMGIPPHARITVDVQRPNTVMDPVDASRDIGLLDGLRVTIASRSGASSSSALMPASTCRTPA